MSWQNQNSSSYGVIKLVLTAVTVLILVFLVLSLFRIGIIFWLYSTIETWVTVRLGLDYYAAQAVTAVAVSIVAFLMPSLAWYVLLGKKKLWGTAVMASFQIMAFVLVYTVGRDVSFDRVTGEPLKYYADTPEGRVFSFTPGFDPKYGLKYEQYTKEIALRSSKAIENKDNQPNKNVCIKARSPITMHYRPRSRKGGITDWIPVRYDPPVPAGHYGMIVEGEGSMIYTKSGRPLYKIVWASKNDPMLVRDPLTQVHRHDYVLSNLIDIINCDLIPAPTPSPSPTDEPITAPAVEIPSTWEIPSLNAKISKIRFFESGNQMPAIGSRSYVNRFSSAAAKYINWEIELTYTTVSENLSTPVETIWSRIGGEALTKQTMNFEISNGTSSTWHAWGWGREAPGYWKEGSYKVEFFADGQKIAAGMFEVYNNNQ